ncbi:hypothetical protein [Microbacterium sp. p3-SID131]|uniref:hypothetical protein n=1 Tax=Microbacterium sp. p3-SID131 TaxID=2916215 RepID=UPI0021A50E21|nr:hypothetical protein [Microbacterium sp. p3-SID131]MCT1363935.1 hypothetical protein [Microbacterium sp. p3-SID131]
MSEQQNYHGSNVFGLGLIVIFVYIVGGGIGSIGTEPHPSLWWSAAGLFFLDVFVASVVTAYYAGRRRR